MAASDAHTGNGTELWIDVGAGLVEVGEIVDLPELPGGDWSTYKTTHMKTGDYEDIKKLPRKEGRSVTIVGNSILGTSATNTLLAAADASLDPVAYKIVTPQGLVQRKYEGTFLVTGYKVLNPTGEGRKFELTVQWADAATEGVET